MRIASIDVTGRLVIAFSEPFFVIKDIAQLKENCFIGSKNRTSIEVIIEPLDSQTTDQLKFSW